LDEMVKYLFHSTWCATCNQLWRIIERSSSRS